MSKFKILIVDSESEILEFMKYNLEKGGFEVYTLTNGKECLKHIKSINPDIILMDVMMTEINGIETCYQIRKDNEISNDLIIIFLSARNDEITQIAAYDSGADDFIAKPIQPRLLNKKLYAITKKLKKQNVTKHGLFIDEEKCKVSKNGVNIKFPKKQFELLKLLYSKPGFVFDRAQIITKVWGSDYYVSHRNIDVQISKIRHKIGENFIITLKGIGYKFIDKEDESR